MKITEQQNEKECVTKLWEILNQKDKTEIKLIKPDSLPDEFKSLDKIESI